MRIYENIDSVDVGSCVITIGAFDGLHQGHMSVLQHLKKVSDAKGLPSVILTFTNHPQLFFNPGSDFRLLTSLDEKKNLLSQTDVDALVLMNFDQTIASMNYGHFIEHVLCKKLNVSHIVMGYDHRFGKNGEGNYPMVKAYAAQFAVEVDLVPELFPGEHLSSSQIRKALALGEVKHAQKLLGYYYGFDAVVIEGRQLGRNMGFPTANLKPHFPEKLLPKTGVYLTRVHVDEKIYFGLLNYGFKPTIGHDLMPLPEVYIFDFNQNLYGMTIRIEFLERIRDEKKFSSIDQLKQQIILDKTTAEHLLLSIEL